MVRYEVLTCKKGRWIADGILDSRSAAVEHAQALADRNYLERLSFLYQEFKEGGIPGFADELDLLQKTPAFWEFTQTRLAGELGGVDRFMRDHFRVRWGIDQDMNRETVERNIANLQFILINHGDDYRRYLRHGGLIKSFRK
jgi:hypothetical protein